MDTKEKAPCRGAYSREKETNIKEDASSVAQNPLKINQCFPTFTISQFLDKKMRCIDSGVYFVLENNRIIYVGATKAKDGFYGRMLEHFQKRFLKTDEKLSLANCTRLGKKFVSALPASLNWSVVFIPIEADTETIFRIESDVLRTIKPAYNIKGCYRR